MTITWIVNEILSSQLGIVTNGTGSPNSSLTIPGYLQYNNTVVTCNAFGFVNGSGYVNFSKSTLRIQGNTVCLGFLPDKNGALTTVCMLHHRVVCQ